MYQQRLFRSVTLITVSTYSDAQILPLFVHCESLVPAVSLFFPSFNVPPPFIKHFLISGTDVPGSSYVSLPLSWNHLFIFKEEELLLWGMVFK